MQRKHQSRHSPKNFTKFAHKVLQDLRAAKKAEASARQDWFLCKCCLRVCRWCYSVNMAFFKDVKWLAWLYILLDMLYVPHVTIIILELWRVVEELFKFYGKDTPPFNDSFVSFFIVARDLAVYLFFPKSKLFADYIIDLNDLYATCWNFNLIRSGHV